MSVPDAVVACWVAESRFPVAVSYVNDSQYGAGPPNVVEDGAAVQEAEDGDHAVTGHRRPRLC
ncbi:hypothetical protein [Gryllotalpicola protaetiae]|uniref:hypothetical protein n=1 Tax=Gryllotalpicola protaetiae TaxID=2419771 RepID=UPI0013C48B77|nr:hypothetical protein [Gryllotalpicola protaetiae]